MALVEEGQYVWKVLRCMTEHPVKAGLASKLETGPTATVVISHTPVSNTMSILRSKLSTDPSILDQCWP